MFTMNSQDKIDSAVKHTIEKILLWTDEDADLARQVAEKLASFDWHQVILEQRQKEIRSQMWAMETFLEWRERGGDFCDDCEYSRRDNYVGGYHHGPQYNKVYSWPHAVSPYSHSAVDHTQGQRYCRKCLNKMQEDTENRLILEYREKHPDVKSYLTWTKRMSDCDECGRLIPERVGYRFVSRPYKVYCLHCVGEVAEHQFTFCQDCGKKTASSVAGYCYDCYPIHKAYGEQVSSHLGRARVAGTPATLTVHEWVTILEYFGEKCAYCQSRPFQVIEHFLPISLGGGTTAQNCVPACQKCNSRKGARHPDRLEGVFPIHVIEHVKAYLQGDKPDHKARPVSCRALVAL